MSVPGKRKSLLIRNSRCRCTFHFLCLWRSGDDGWKGLSHVPYSGKNDRGRVLAAAGPTGSIYYFIVSYNPLAKYTGKKLQFYSVILLLSDRVPEDGTTVRITAAPIVRDLVGFLGFG